MYQQKTFGPLILLLKHRTYNVIYSLFCLHAYSVVQHYQANMYILLERKMRMKKRGHQGKAYIHVYYNSLMHIYLLDTNTYIIQICGREKKNLLTIPSDINGLLKSITRCRSDVIVIGAMAMSASCNERKCISVKEYGGQ